ncbi:hypothetical protein [Dyadobacter diqingensis]|uniref:hypothetical protein n=1 Tax=Dyadobacter diqingensis TaxID=2938121 RepID=UPI0020C1A399|nr:hypothetical protein [Dyadobacter diqingensis]
MKFIAIPLLLLPLFTLGQQTDWKLMKLRGKPKLVMTRDYYVHYSHFSRSGYLILTTTEIQGELYRTEFEYAADGRKSQEINYKNGEISDKITYSYDSKGRQQESRSRQLVEVVMAEGPKVTFDRKIKKNDKYGNPLKITMTETVEGRHPEISETELFHYKYDKYGNWIERERELRFRDDKEFRQGGISEREITYY